MTHQQLLTADVLDILFEHRNKLYGAYALRKTYPSRLAKALVLAIASIVLLLVLVRPRPDAHMVHPPVAIDPVVPIEMPKEKKGLPPPAPTPAASRSMAQKKWTSQIKIVDDKVWKPEDMPKQEELSQAAISTINAAGDIPADNHPPLITDPKSTGHMAATESGETFLAVEREPQFPGGRQAWLDFLSRYLIAPADLQAGEKKTVLVRFLVDAEGRVTDFEVVQSAGIRFDNEVLRVLKKMPRWQPAIQNGHHVAVSFTQPVTFIGTEE